MLWDIRYLQSNQIILCYALKGYENKIEALSSLFDSNFFQFCNLQIFWYQVLIQNKIYQENILFDLETTHKIEIDILNINNSDFLEYNLNQEIDSLNSFNFDCETPLTLSL